MKTIKFFSFFLLVSLVWVACKDNTTTTTEAEKAAVMADSVFTVTKEAAAYNLNALDQALTAKITELEAAVAAATDATKTDLTNQLNTFKQQQTDLQAVNAKVASATAETWATVGAEVENVHMTVKSALTAPAAQNTVNEAAGKLTN